MVVVVVVAVVVVVVVVLVVMAVAVVCYLHIIIMSFPPRLPTGQIVSTSQYKDGQFLLLPWWQ